MMAMNNNAAVDIELLPGELMRQLSFSNSSVETAQVPVQQSRIVLPDDSDEDRIEQIEIDPPHHVAASNQVPDIKQKRSDPKTQPARPKAVPAAETVLENPSYPQSIPVQVKLNHGQSPLPSDHSYERAQRWQPMPTLSAKQRSNRYPAPSSARHHHRRHRAEQRCGRSCCNYCSRQGHCDQVQWSPAYEPKRTYVAPGWNPFLSTAPDYYIYNARPAVVPMIPIIW